jgi:hypothetical protein
MRCYNHYTSAESRKKHSYWSNKLSTAKHKRIIHFMITGETEIMVFMKEEKEKS